MIRHILLIKFKDSAELSQIDKLSALFESMPNKVEGVIAVEWGLNDSPENKNKGYTHSVVMTFANEEGRQNYLPHPEHEALKEVLRSLLEDIVVFDYQV
ncbi:Stress responsive alpha-beta barrel domain protein Dabb [Moritella sp. JT01]|uniref:Dabb family protein n=1 Tax=Moritella sp. JT01 TaxID=756698 RepID=UPI000791EC06|nr:Dabb family protein [Moritella sp. JT01]KXO13093.1 Stress responsive alpha-beta barrel domain protein Dabb [Moritella sp. JT01]